MMKVTSKDTGAFQVRFVYQVSIYQERQDAVFSGSHDFPLPALASCDIGRTSLRLDLSAIGETETRDLTKRTVFPKLCLHLASSSSSPRKAERKTQYLDRVRGNAMCHDNHASSRSPVRSCRDARMYLLGEHKQPLGSVTDSVTERLRMEQERMEVPQMWSYHRTQTDFTLLLAYTSKPETPLPTVLVPVSYSQGVHVIYFHK